MEPQKKMKRSPGGGRKPLAKTEKKVDVRVYVAPLVVKTLGGLEKTKKMVANYLLETALTK